MSASWSDAEKELALNLLEGGIRDCSAIAAELKKQIGTERTVNGVKGFLLRQGKRDLTSDANTCKPATDGLTIDEVVSHDRQQQNLKDKISVLNRKYQAVQRDTTFQEELIEAIRKTCCQFDPVPPPKYKPSSVKLINETAVVELSDWHLGETVSNADTGGLAEYDMEMAAMRLQQLADTVIDITQNKLKGYRLRKLEVLALGDFASTNIHKLLQHSIFTPVDSLLIGGFLIAQFLLDMSRIFEEVCVSCVVGNHGRLDEKKSYQRRYTNWDYVLYNQLSFMLLGQPNITFNIPESFWMLQKIEGWDFLLLHGDDIRMWNQIPWYGILRALRSFQELLNAQDLKYDYAALGHFHNAGTLDRCKGEFLLNGSAIGPTTFSIGSMFTGTPPKQLLYGVHPEHGVTWRYKVRLDKIPADMKMRYRFQQHRQINEQLREVLYAS